MKNDWNFAVVILSKNLDFLGHLATLNQRELTFTKVLKNVTKIKNSF